jgi:acyl-CoA reductase-like NAD-dependent aldehyde dehydrogenase
MGHARRDPSPTFRPHPLILPGVQIIQGLVAGNGILFKPAAGTHAIAKLLSETLRSCGVPDSAMILLDQSPDAAKCYYSQIDKVIVTGSADTGQAVARDLAEHNKPAIMELSGCDAAIVLPNADIQLAAACIRFGLAFNGSNSCIAPRRLLVHASVADALVSELAKGLATIPALPIPAQFCPRIDELVKDALDHGAKLVFGNWPAQNNLTPLLLDYGKPCMRLQREDIGLPIASIVRVNDVSGIIAASARCPFKLGASIFGPPDEGMELAKSLDAGSIVINDCMAPTADPRLPFGGGGASGFGSTRGAEGLLQMTRPKTIQACTHSLRFHLRKETASTADLLRAQLQMTHARTRSRQFAGLKKLIACARTSRKETTP